MINLYYCLDPGVLESLKEDFVRENLNYQVISCESFENLFGSLEQNSLFDAPEAFIINNPIFLTNKWKEMREKDNDSKSNNLQIDRFVRIMQHLKMSNINVLILVYSPSLLTNKSIKGLLDLVDNSDHKKEVLNARTKKAFIDNLIKKNNVKFETNLNNLVYDFFPKDALFIREIFHKIAFLKRKKISMKDLQQLVGNYKEQDFFLLIDWLLSEKKEWIEVFNNKCTNLEDAKFLLNILNYKVEELFAFYFYKKSINNIMKIAELMGRPPYALNSYVKIYNDLGPKLSAKLDKIIVKLFDYNVSIRKNDAISVLELKKTLLSF